MFFFKQKNNHRFNAVSEWVSSEVLSADGRVPQMIAHFIDVAEALVIDFISFF